jgi:hypothetical protein
LQQNISSQSFQLPLQNLWFSFKSFTKKDIPLI